ncbi:Gpi16 subunit, GPI transamidase component [Ascobolus immersus RN42]|uniref:Gpi16 subunit, GPI transamidase component n=1 Tax=Ascobolus immersus RN42 TaxID=1160509 RepID=A0A3N4IJ43_ASCIM|nr:Gpi16 subunit, GPI transamidase component [Ascobolus immersus RN42]
MSEAPVDPSTIISHSHSSTSDYSESLFLRTLPNNALLASFQFRTNGTIDSSHMSLFPQSLNQVLKASHTKELHLKFTLGRWKAREYGPEPWEGRTAGGTGVELWAWVDAEDDAQAEQRWKTLTNALSGLFCASLNFIDSTRTIRPILTFHPTGTHDPTSNLHLLHGSLPREPVCTENLTPFLKLLPCKGKVGVSSLLDGHKLFDAAWQAMSIDVRPLCDSDGTNCKLQMEQTVDMVIDVERSLLKQNGPIPKPKERHQLVCDGSKEYLTTDDACLPLDNVKDQQFTLTDVFGRGIRGSCPLDEMENGEAREQVCLNVPEQRGVYLSEGYQEQKLSKSLRCYALKENQDFDLILTEQSPSIKLPSTEPLLYAERSFTGHGQERGGVQAVLRNPSLTSPVNFVYLESLPWFMKPYLHTLRANLDKPAPTNSSSSPILETHYRPFLDRKRGTQLEIALQVPANTTLTLTYEFDKAILRYTEYPPDANRGFDIAPAIIAILPPSSLSDGALGATQQPTYLRTTSLLLPLPTPDFSMPYNVIILTSTVMALAFGSILNLLIRRFVGADEVPGVGSGLKEKVRGKLRRLGLGGKKKEE